MFWRGKRPLRAGSRNSWPHPGQSTPGNGAVGAVALAAIGDVTRPEVRAQAFTITGMTIGMAFMLGVLAGPMLAPILGLKGLFFLLAGFSVIGELFVARYFPQHSAFSKAHRTAFRLPPLGIGRNS